MKFEEIDDYSFNVAINNSEYTLIGEGQIWYNMYSREFVIIKKIEKNDTKGLKVLVDASKDGKNTFSDVVLDVHQLLDRYVVKQHEIKPIFRPQIRNKLKEIE